MVEYVPARATVEGSSWPGERDASHRDVEVANEPLEPGFLDSFKSALLASSAARNNEDLLHGQLQNTHPIGGYTYPLSVLYDFPELPTQEHIDFLTQSFTRIFAHDAFVNTLPISSQSQQVTVPFFKLSLACLACAALPDNMVSVDRRDLARRLFFAGNSLWNVMLEVDNTEARTLEGALSPMLLTMYGVLSADVDIWNLIEHQLLPSSSTIVRRLRLQETEDTGEITAEELPSVSTRSSVVAFLLLVSVLSALHMDIPIYLTSNELGILLDPRPIYFHQAYASLLSESNLSRTWTPHAKPLILLIAILSDAISINRSLNCFSKANTSSSGETLAQIPYVPLSVQSEYQRMSDQLSYALDSWSERFGSGEGSKHLELYFFCRLYLSCPQSSSLPRLANYPPAVQTSPSLDAVKSVEDMSISDEAIGHAWAVLDNVNLWFESGEATYPTWFPIIIFFAGLIVWARTQQQKEAWNSTSSPIQLVAFKVQLDRIPWPCCREMASTMDRLTRER